MILMMKFTEPTSEMPDLPSSANPFCPWPSSLTILPFPTDIATLKSFTDTLHYNHLTPETKWKCDQNRYCIISKFLKYHSRTKHRAPAWSLYHITAIVQRAMSKFPDRPKRGNGQLMCLQTITITPVIFYLHLMIKFPTVKIKCKLNNFSETWVCPICFSDWLDL